MGLDGISVNQLRISSELNSGELNKINQENFPQVVDGLTQGQRINADEKKEKEEKQLPIGYYLCITNIICLIIANFNIF